MAKNILIIKGSPRKNGNTDRLADAFIKGAKETGNNVEEIAVRELKVSGCLGCNGCKRNDGSCVQKDDMNRVYDAIDKADAILLSCPVYFYSWPSGLKAVLDSLYAKETILQNKKFYMIISGAAPEEKYMVPISEAFENYVSCFRAGGNEIGDILIACGNMQMTDVAEKDDMRKAEEMGRSIA